MTSLQAVAEGSRKRPTGLFLGAGAVVLVLVLVLAYVFWPDDPAPASAPGSGTSSQEPTQGRSNSLADRPVTELQGALPEEAEFPAELRPVRTDGKIYDFVPPEAKSSAGIGADTTTYSTPECKNNPLTGRSLLPLISEGRMVSKKVTKETWIFTYTTGVHVAVGTWALHDSSAELPAWIEKCGKFDVLESFSSGGSVTDQNEVERLQDPVTAQTQGVGYKSSEHSVGSRPGRPDTAFESPDEYFYFAFLRGVIITVSCKEFPDKTNYLPIAQKMFVETYQKLQALP